MTSQETLAVYEALAELTGQMLAAASASDWEGLIALEQRCAAQVQRLQNGGPGLPLDSGGRQKKLSILKQLLDDDRKIRDLTTPWMAQLAALIHNTGTQRRLAGAYGHA
ncbi:flagellar protein FliT [Oxalobacteraceae bacterium GrIS 1.11]